MPLIIQHDLMASTHQRYTYIIAIAIAIASNQSKLVGGLELISTTVGKHTYISTFLVTLNQKQRTQQASIFYT
jgi:hypothetical protein